MDGHPNISKAAPGEPTAEKNEGGSLKHYAIGLKVTKPMVCVCGRHKTEVNAMASHVGSMPATQLDVALHYLSC